MIQKKSIKSFFILIIVLSLNANILNAKDKTNIRINEILTNNTNSCIDEYGNYVPWIEIVNTDYHALNIGGYYLTNDINNPKKSWIPTGDPRTIIAIRNYILIFGDGNSKKGIFHTNFNLNETNFLALFSSDGKTLIDSITFPKVLKENISYARINADSDIWKTGKATPLYKNERTHKKSAGEKFKELDPYGAGMTVIATTVVFLALILLYVFFKISGNIFKKRNKIPDKNSNTKNTISINRKHSKEDEINAAIAMSIHLFENETHVKESNILTINQNENSAWKTKNYTTFLRKK